MAQEAGEPSETLAMPGSSPYPYGLRLHLTHVELEKLGYTELPPAGTELHLEAIGVVTRAATEDPDADGDVDYCCVEVQIKELGLEEEAEEEPERDDGETAERMYGGKGKK